jgi:hypothetical protein
VPVLGKLDEPLERGGDVLGAPSQSEVNRRCDTGQRDIRHVGAPRSAQTRGDKTQADTVK